MKLKCNICGRKETEPYDIGDTCWDFCGGKFYEIEEYICANCGEKFDSLQNFDEHQWSNHHCQFN